MTLGVLILLGLVIAEGVTLAKLGKQGKRIDKLEEETGKERKK